MYPGREKKWVKVHAHHRDEHSGGSGVGKEAGHDPHDDHDGHNENSFALGKARNKAANPVGHASLKQGLTYHEHADAER